MLMLPSITELPQLTRVQAIRCAVLRVVSDGSREAIALLERVTDKEWSELLRWLDVSGMALYFLDCVLELGLTELLPACVLKRLQQNLADNTIRTGAMIAEAAAIRDAFYEQGLNFALLKGLSLTPHSVARPELRSQLDIDFLVAQEDVTAARHVLERRGYYLHAVSGRSWEFKTYAVPTGSLRDLYRNVPWRSVELHAEQPNANYASRLVRRKERIVSGMEMPVLCDSDLFLGQGLHLFKHVCSAHYRAAHLVEFHRHLLAQREDISFWRGLEVRAAETGAAGWALGVVTRLAEQLLSECAPTCFVHWTVDRLSNPVRLWIEMYGWRGALDSIPGSKLYALLAWQLEKEGLETRASSSAPQPKSELNSELRSARGLLVPRRLPAMVVRGQAKESLRTRLARFRLYFRFLLLRLRFHSVEGLRFLIEARRWKRRLRKLDEAGTGPIRTGNKEMTIL